MTPEQHPGVSQTFDKFNQITKSWKAKKKRVYKAGRKVDTRIKSLARCLPFFKGEVVVDIGPNQGLFTVLTALYAKKAVGVEHQARYYDQAREFAKACNSRARFVNMGIAEYVKSGLHIKKGVTAVLASRVLYHLEENSTGMPELETLMETCSKLLFVSREHRKKLSKHVRLHKYKNIVKFVKKRGFEIADVVDKGTEDVKVLAVRRGR